MVTAGELGQKYQNAGGWAAGGAEGRAGQLRAGSGGGGSPWGRGHGGGWRRPGVRAGRGAGAGGLPPPPLPPPPPALLLLLPACLALDCRGLLPALRLPPAEDYEDDFM